MSSQFELDAQTLKDLNIFDERQGGSISSMFSNTHTVAGRMKVRSMMKSPSNNRESILTRQNMLRLIDSHDIRLRLVNHEMEFIEHYLNFSCKVLGTEWYEVLSIRAQSLFNKDQNLYTISHGIYLTAKLIKTISGFSNLYTTVDKRSNMIQISDFTPLKPDSDVFAYLNNPTKEISLTLLIKMDSLFRKTHINTVKRMLDYAYELDAYGAILSTKNKYSLCFPDINDADEIYLNIKGVFHPYVVNAIPNNVEIRPSKNIIFLTGANMSGKSVYLKAVGISVYLAHVGFPVFAQSMAFSAWNGLVSCINLSDNIGSGYSHYYSEIMRLKYAVTSVNKNKRMFILFDELFKGTNAEDAMDASILLIKELSNIRDSAFYLSSHLLDLSNKLQALNRLSFQCFTAKVENNELTFDYILREGVSKDRVGLQIFLNSNILDTLTSKQ